MESNERVVCMKICPICKKKFYKYTPDWAWKTHDYYFCSYTCAREYDKRKSPDKRRLCGRPTPVIIDGIYFKTIAEASDKMDICDTSIKKAVRMNGGYVKGHLIEVAK